MRVNHIIELCNAVCEAIELAETDAGIFFAARSYPKTVSDKAANMRSHLRATIETDQIEGFVLSSRYPEFGEIVVTDEESGTQYWLKSLESVKTKSEIEARSLFDPTPYESDEGNVVALLYEVQEDHIGFFTAPAVRASPEPDRLLDEPKLVHSVMRFETEAFDQGEVDRFEDLVELEENLRGADEGNRNS